MSLQVSSLHITTAAVKPKTPPGRLFMVSPALYGRTSWNLDQLSRMNVSSSGVWTLTPTTDFTANVKMWGGSGGSYSSGGTSGAGGYTGGTASFVAGVPYTLVVGGGGALQLGAGSPSIGGGGYALNTTVNSPQGGGLSGIFSGSYTQNRSILIAGGGGSKIGGGGYTAGAGGGSSGQADNKGHSTGGTQVAGGTGGYPGTALQGSYCSAASTNWLGAGGGGYFGGGGRDGVSVGSGGSGYIKPGIVTGGSTIAGSYGTPGNASDADRGSAGNGIATVGTGMNGRVIIS